MELQSELALADLEIGMNPSSRTPERQFFLERFSAFIHEIAETHPKNALFLVETLGIECADQNVDGSLLASSLSAASDLV
jgi:hypothetical protein